jgi:hypothetical protein
MNQGEDVTRGQRRGMLREAGSEMFRKVAPPQSPAE